jgi:hypothetical protein
MSGSRVVDCLGLMSSCGTLLHLRYSKGSSCKIIVPWTCISVTGKDKDNKGTDTDFASLELCELKKCSYYIQVTLCRVVYK